MENIKSIEDAIERIASIHAAQEMISLGVELLSERKILYDFLIKENAIDTKTKLLIKKEHKELYNSSYENF